MQTLNGQTESSEPAKESEEQLLVRSSFWRDRRKTGLRRLWELAEEPAGHRAECC